MRSVQMRTIGILFSLFAPLCIALTPSQCEFFDSHMGATFSLSGLKRQGDEPSYFVTDGDIPCTEQIEQNYTYLFNLCGSVSGQVPMACASKSNAAALQIDKRLTPTDPNDDLCFAAGRLDDLTTMSLIDQNDPTKGIVLSYQGDICRHDGEGNPAQIPRKFNVELTCDSNMTPVPIHAYETEHCHYTVSMPSIYGCPLECPIGDRAVCGGNGHCAYDTDKAKARCFCNKGYTGSNCLTKSSTSSHKNYNPALLGLIITLFVVSMLLVVLIVAMFKQVNAYKQDATNYMALHGGDTDTGV